MLSYNDAFYGLKNNLQSLYDAQEAAAIAHEVLEHLTGFSKMQRLLDKDKLLTEAQQQQFNQIATALQNSTPLQYALGTAWFMGRQFMVDSNVLIPRPETEELVQWIIDDHKDSTLSILDIGTGSGCIPISLKLALPNAEVNSCDISEGALATAQKNATVLQADIIFLQHDVLNEHDQQQLDNYDIIVSNPPYIPINEKETLHENVRNHEPSLALFVPNDDPQLFYRTIAEFGLAHLKQNGIIYFELHVDYANDTEALLRSIGYQTELRKDIHGNLRMLKAWQ
jgi:release factor glutamine methyltransferase